MTRNIPIVRKLQADAVDQDTPVSDLLRMAKIVATKLGLSDALAWIDRELNGYLDLTVAELPPYRRLTGEPRAWNPYRGWQSIHFPDADHARFFSQAPIGQALPSIEKSLLSEDGGQYSFPYPPEIKSRLVKAISFQTDVCIHLDDGSLWNIVDQVRNLVLDWSLELEKAGVVGEDMTFTADEKKDAAPVSQNFFVQNVGVLGNVTDHTNLTLSQHAALSLDPVKVSDLVEQARAALPMMPEVVRETLAPVLDTLEKEISANPADQSKLHMLLGSIRSICEGAAGNLAAEGLLGILRQLFS